VEGKKQAFKTRGSSVAGWWIERASAAASANGIPIETGPSFQFRTHKFQLVGLGSCLGMWKSMK